MARPLRRARSGVLPRARLARRAAALGLTIAGLSLRARGSRLGQRPAGLVRPARPAGTRLHLFAAALRFAIARLTLRARGSRLGQRPAGLVRTARPAGTRLLLLAAALGLAITRLALGALTLVVRH